MVKKRVVAKKKIIRKPSKRVKNTIKKLVKKKTTKSVKKQPIKAKKIISTKLLSKKTSPKKVVKKIIKSKSRKIDITSISNEMNVELQGKQDTAGYLFTGINGFDELLTRGIPKGSAVLVSGGAGSGKTLFCLQTLFNHAKKGKTCYYMSFEESELRLQEHMKDFGWDVDKQIKKGNLVIKRYSPFEITRSVDALLMKEKGELLIDIDPVILPKGFKPDIIVVDSLTAVASAFTKGSDSYRIYIEQLFRFFEKLESTSFLITETEQVPTVYSTKGVEEFLADGVIVLYSINRGNIRENAIEILKLRGTRHQKKIVAMVIDDAGVSVYPTQEVLGEIRPK